MKNNKAKLMAIKTAGYILSAIVFIISFVIYYKMQNNPWWRNISLGQWAIISSVIILFLDTFFYKRDKEIEKEIKGHMDWLKGSSVIILLFITISNTSAQKKPIGLENIKYQDAVRIGWTSPDFEELIPKKLVAPYDTSKKTNFGKLTRKVIVVNQTKETFPVKNIKAENIDTPTKKVESFIFKKEKTGQICLNGLEKLEFAASTNKNLAFIVQEHFYAPRRLEGRFFIQIESEWGEKIPLFWINGAFDLTRGEFPLHAGIDVGFNQLHKTISYGWGFDLYWSDIPKFYIGGKSINISKYFHILRTGGNLMSFASISELKSVDGEDSVDILKKPEFSLFFQSQPLHINKNLSIFCEGSSQLVNKHNNFFELEVGLKHEKILDNLIGIGLRLAYEDSYFHSFSGVIRFNVSNPNPKHLNNEVKKKKKKKSIASSFRGRCFFICKIIELGA